MPDAHASIPPPSLAAPGAPGATRLIPAALGAALVAGLAFAAWPADRPAALLALAGAAAAALALAVIGPRAWRTPATLLALAVALAVGGGVARRCAEARLLPAGPFGRGWIVGVVDGMPERGEDGARFVLEVRRSSLRLAQGVRLACYAHGPPPAHDGDRVRLLADVAGEEGRRNPGGFDERAWARVAGLAGRARVVPGAWARLAGPSPWNLRARWVSPLRERLLTRVVAQERGRPGAFLAGFLLGERTRLDPASNDDLRRAGALHLLAISGMHVALALALVGRALRLLGLRGRRAAALRLCAALGYSALAGGSASVWRAGASALAVETGALCGRAVGGEQALALALLGLVAFRPAFALDAGFQLSLLATWGLFALARPLERALRERIEEWWAAPRRLRALALGASEALAPTLGAQAASLPCLAAQFGTVSALGLASNLLLVPVTDVALLAGLLALAGEVVLPGAARAFWLPADAAAALTLRIAGALARVPGALVPLSGPPWAVASLGAALAAAVAWRAGVRARWLAGLATACALGGALGLALPPAAPRAPLVWTVLDVGQGDGMVLRFADGRSLVVDGGMADAAVDRGSRVVLPALRARGVRGLDLALATHRDLDHMGGLPSVVRDVPCARVGGPGDVPDRILSQARRRGGALGPSRRTEIARGDTVLAGAGYCVRCLWPPRGFRADRRWTPNRESVVLLVELTARDTLRCLLMGDADTLVERALLAGGLPRCAALKVGHHGSSTSSGDALLDAVRPRVALVSVGRVNRFGHPSPLVRARYARHGIAWRSTAEEGALDVVVSRQPSGALALRVAPAR